MQDIQVSDERQSSPKDTKAKMTGTRGTRTKRRGIAILLTALSFVVVAGMIGLATDVSILYFLKARLSQAADAAALSGARTLSRGADIDAQAANAQVVAVRYFNANFPNGFWGCTTSIPTPVVTQDANSKIRYVTITATATAPLYFLRSLGFRTTTLGTSAQAARRDANIMVILDRSGSMSSAISQLVTSADWFEGNFAPGRDKVGLVTFGGTYNLIKPTTSFSPSVVNAINTLDSGTVNGTTNHSQPLWVAYQALAEANEPTALNAIVFFTDGQPNTITADWQPKLATLANCNKGLTGGVYNPVIGFVLTYVGSTSTAGLFATTMIPPYQPDSTAVGTKPTAYVSTASDANDPLAERILLSTSSGCNFWNNHDNISADLNGIPTVDIYGNETNRSASRYKVASLSPFSGSGLVNAAFNAGDEAARRMRAGVLGTPTPIVPLIDTISLVTTGPIDPIYMKRLANTLDSPIYDSTKPTGLYVAVNTTADLQSAFVQIASQILHLSQ
jgi:Mg-chelatase subunit ChlD